MAVDKRLMIIVTALIRHPLLLSYKTLRCDNVLMSLACSFADSSEENELFWDGLLYEVVGDRQDRYPLFPPLLAPNFGCYTLTFTLTFCQVTGDPSIFSRECLVIVPTSSHPVQTATLSEPAISHARQSPEAFGMSKSPATIRSSLALSRDSRKDANPTRYSSPRYKVQPKS
jgi:hypothetical protein